jgi:hypothetical protein
MDVYFSPFTNTQQLSVSYKSHFSRKFCKNTGHGQPDVHINYMTVIVIDTLRQLYQ